MKTTRSQILPIQFLATAALPLAITRGQIRRSGIIPLLTKSIPAQMAARAVRTATPATTV